MGIEVIIPRLCYCTPIGTLMEEQGTLGIPTNVTWAGQTMKRDLKLEAYRCPLCSEVKFFSTTDLKGSLGT